MLYLVKNEISALNLMMAIKPAEKIINLKESTKIIKMVLINALQMHSLVNFKEIKKELSLILSPKIRLEETINLVGELEANGKKLGEQL